MDRGDDPRLDDSSRATDIEGIGHEARNPGSQESRSNLSGPSEWATCGTAAEFAALIAEEAPIVYLVHPDVLVAVSPEVRNAAPSALPPHLFWNIESLWLAGNGQRRKN